MIAGAELMLKVRCLIACMIALCNSVSVVQVAAFTVSPDTTYVSDGIASYKVETLSEKDVRAHTSSFGWQLDSCSIMIDIPVGVADGNVSHGALCLRKEGKDIRHVFVCYDEMVGHSDIANVYDADANKVNLIQFTMDHCFGG